MYKEPHLQCKSDECAALWREWYEVKYVERNNERAKTLRDEWCKCADQLGEMVHQEAKKKPGVNFLRRNTH